MDEGVIGENVNMDEVMVEENAIVDKGVIGENANMDKASIEENVIVDEDQYEQQKDNKDINFVHQSEEEYEELESRHQSQRDIGNHIVGEKLDNGGEANCISQQL
ncbi:hypothetical protein L2E82_12783 [Cichorium intybus]|uniref:Uncharacterized protein n=1 Tax=Cichorium intybus TaxID=13427 RepID=A0ACB9GGT1_CICIN|nr:hypothetical protein L2E82_12783 [Cichorium intybus]